MFRPPPAMLSLSSKACGTGFDTPSLLSKRCGSNSFAVSHAFSVGVGVQFSSSVVRHFVASSRARTVHVVALVNAVRCRVVHRCGVIIAPRVGSRRSEIHRTRRGPLEASRRFLAHPAVIHSALSTSFQHSRIGASALSSLSMLKQRHSFRLPPHHRLVATGFIGVPSSCVGAPALQPQRWA